MRATFKEIAKEAVIKAESGSIDLSAAVEKLIQIDSLFMAMGCKQENIEARQEAMKALAMLINNRVFAMVTLCDRKDILDRIGKK